MSTHNRLFFRVIVERCDISLPSGHGTDGHDGAGCSTDVRTRSSFRTLCSQSQPGSEHKRQFSYSVYATLHTCGIFRVQSGIAFAHCGRSRSPSLDFHAHRFSLFNPPASFFFFNHTLLLSRSQKLQEQPSPYTESSIRPRAEGSCQRHIRLQLESNR
jgi:hypothetical protein